jgi:hypothetical protein
MIISNQLIKIHYVFFTENLSPFLIRLSACFSTSSVLLDFYSDLELDQSANAKSIKEAYYKLSKKYHPDVNAENPDALRKFQVRCSLYVSPRLGWVFVSFRIVNKLITPSFSHI